MYIHYLILILSASIFFTGCAVGEKSLPLSYPFQVSGPAVSVTVIRAKQLAGSYPMHYISLDDIPIVALKTGEYTVFEVSPGIHQLSVLHHVIDKPLLLGSGPAAFPAGVHYGRYGKSITQDFKTGGNYLFLLTSKGFVLDENERVSIERIDLWPQDILIDSQNFVKPGNNIQ